MPFSDSRQSLVTVEGLPGFFAKLSGGSKSTPSSEAYDGGSQTPQVITGPATFADLTVSRPFDPARDGPILASLKRQVGSFRTTVTSIFCDPQFIPVGGSESWMCVLVDVTGPQVDAQKTGATISEIVLKLKPYASS